VWVGNWELVLKSDRTQGFGVRRLVGYSGVSVRLKVRCIGLVVLKAESEIKLLRDCDRL